MPRSPEQQRQWESHRRNTADTWLERIGGQWASDQLFQETGRRYGTYGESDDAHNSQSNQDARWIVEQVRNNPGVRGAREGDRAARQSIVSSRGKKGRASTILTGGRRKLGDRLQRGRNSLASDDDEESSGSIARRTLLGY